MEVERYKAISGSQLGHGCCFNATVVDTTKAVPIEGERYHYHESGEYEVVCETHEMKDAEMIAAALNRNEKWPPPG